MSFMAQFPYHDLMMLSLWYVFIGVFFLAFFYKNRKEK
jgi:hypothetical protein